MRVSKYHGLGNDFIITEFDENINYSAYAIKFCKRRVSIGADGFIVVKKNPLEMIFFNADGSYAPMCGNGIRAFARYVYEKNIVKSLVFDVITGAGIMKIEILDTVNFDIKINMGSPKFDLDLLSTDALVHAINLSNYQFKVYSIFLGTVHSVVFSDHVVRDSEKFGEMISNNEFFKDKTNVNFINVLDRNTIVMRTYERGVGLTLACGTGACSSVVVANNLGLVDDEVIVLLEEGRLLITLDDNNVYMQGFATKVFDTEVFYD